MSSMIEDMKEEAASEIAAELEEEKEKEQEVIEEPVVEESHEGKYRSELTGLWIDEGLRDQRPVAIMVDNESKALPHFGVNDSDVVYELMNSTANDRITRLMCVVKDWKKISQLGSIRSTRPTNIPLAAEWNAVLIHDGGPFYIDEFIAKDYCDHLSGGFKRINNGKATEFTEYVTTGELESRMSSGKIGEEYNKYYIYKGEDDGEYTGTHFNFLDSESDLSQYSDAIDCKEIVLPFKHTNSTLKYNESTKTYDYYLYGNAHNDGASGKILSFKNVFLQGCSFNKLDPNGYLIYNYLAVPDKSINYNVGYYISNGKAVPVIWYKGNDIAPTAFYHKGEEGGDETIGVNPGNSYICLVPSDTWDDISIK